MPFLHVRCSEVFLFFDRGLFLFVFEIEKRRFAFLLSLSLLSTVFLISIFNFQAIGEQRKSGGDADVRVTSLQLCMTKNIKLTNWKILSTFVEFIWKNHSPTFPKRAEQIPKKIRTKLLKQEKRSHFASSLRGKHLKSVANKAHFIACRSEWPAR